MMENYTFELWAKKLGLPEQGKYLINKVRSQPAARIPSSKRGNVIGRFPSRKMGYSVAFESHTVELARIYEHELDDEVLEYYTQPIQIQLEYYKKSRRVVVMHTPDLLVLCKDSVFFEECKTEDELKKIRGESSTKFVLDKGLWRCPPGEQRTERYNIGYKVFSSEKINWTLLRNVDFLMDYFRSEHKVSQQVEDYILEIVEKNPGIRLNELLSLAKN